MKKFVFVMPLMAISLLASCGSKPFDPSKIDLYKKEIRYDKKGKTLKLLMNMNITIKVYV